MLGQWDDRSINHAYYIEDCRIFILVWTWYAVVWQNQVWIKIDFQNFKLDISKLEKCQVQLENPKFKYW